VTKQARSEQTRLQLLRSGAELFDRNGFAGATLEDVCRAAGMTKGAFYFHYSGKVELAGAIQAEARTMLRSLVYKLSTRRARELQSLIDLSHVVARWLESEPIVRATFRITRECGHRGRPFLDFYLEWLSAVEMMLRRAERAGELSEGVVIEVVSTLLLTVCIGIEVLWWSGVRDGGIRDSLAAMWQLILPGIVAAGGMNDLHTGGSAMADPNA
jgi:AcrR family transcriptional regulator